MRINRKNAITLWKKRYGNKQKVEDFAGREMAMGAYGDEHSKFGWNIDHIVPVSLNGGNSDNNLVCCHIQTNHEKSDNFPEFITNRKEFEIMKENKKIKIIEKNSTEIQLPKVEKGKKIKKVKNGDYSLGLVEGMVKTVLVLKSCGKKDKEIAKIISEQFNLFV